MNRFGQWMLCVVGVLLLGIQACRADEFNDAADAVLAQYFDGEGPGAAVAVLVGGDVLVKTAIGYADVGKEIEIESGTLFDLASVSKHFTAFAVLALEAQGSVDSAQPVARYLPDFAVESGGRPVRVGDLIHHVSGLADYSGEEWEGDDSEFAQLSNEDHLLWLNDQESPETPGEVYRYNNSGYVLMSLIVEQVSKQRFADFLSTRLFRPSGMKSARVMDDHRLRFPHQAKGYACEDGECEPSSFPSSVTGDGNIYASLNDMIAWMRALDGDAILSANDKRRVWSNGKLDSGESIEDDDGAGYGYGWVVDDDGVVSHSGSWMGTATYVLRDRRNGISVVVLSNDENAEVADIAEELRALCTTYEAS